MSEIVINKISTSTIRKMDLNYSSNILNIMYHFYMDLYIFKFFSKLDKQVYLMMSQGSKMRHVSSMENFLGIFSRSSTC